MTKSEGRGVHYRDLAAKCREKGDEMPNGQARALMLEVATAWEWLAELDDEITKQAGRAEEQRTEATAPRG
jgi:hypothetical protein